MAPQVERTSVLTGRRMILRLGLDDWNNLIVLFLIAGAVFGVLAGGATYVAFQLQKQESKASKDEYEKYKLTVAGQVADATKAGINAGKEAGGAILKAAEANERAANLEREAAGLRLELANVRAPLVERRLRPEQVDVLVKSLAGKQLTTILIAPSPDREINTYAKDFIFAFEKAGTPFNVKVIAGEMQQGGINAVPDGLNVAGDDGPNKAAVETAFREAGISFGH